jgi:hypothetical protein
MIGIDEMKSTDDLYTSQWVNEYGREIPGIIQPMRNRRTIHNHPKNRLELPWTLVICIESEHISVHNNLLPLLKDRTGPRYLPNAPKGNILVLKQSKTLPINVLDVNPTDVALITEVILWLV